MIKQAVFASSECFTGCHAATLAATGSGKVLAAWFAGSHEGHTDVGIWISKQVDSGGWEVPRQVAKVNQTPHWNPVLFSPGNGRIYLYFKIGKTIPGWETWVMNTADDGATWSEPVELVPGDRGGGRGPVKNKPIVTAAGTWLAPASVETLDCWQAFCDISTDQGRTWAKSNLIGFADSALVGKGVIQPALWESRPGHVHMLLRSTCGRICRSDSTDGGHTWSAAAVTELPNNNSGIDLTKLDDGGLLLVYNPVSDNHLRTPLRVSLSRDNGCTWIDMFDLEADSFRVGHLIRQDGGEFSYPSILAHGDLVSGVYTKHRRQIMFWQERAGRFK